MTKKGLHILIADDDEEDLELFEYSLVNINPNARLKKVKNGRAVLEYLNSKEDTELPSLIVLDYSMPELTGLQVLQKIYTNQRYQAIPVIILSTSSSPVHITECKVHGAADYFVKPNTTGELDKLTEKMLQLCA